MKEIWQWCIAFNAIILFAPFVRVRQKKGLGRENCEIFRKFFSVIVDVRRVRVVVFTERVLLTIIFNNQHASAEMVPQISGRIVYGQYRR
jgi:hypothetical protein